MPPKKKYETRIDTKRNLLQNFNQVSNNKKPKNEQEKPKNEQEKSKTKETTMNHLLKAMEKIRSKKRNSNSNSNSSTKKSKSLSPLPFKMVPKRNYHKTNVPNVIVQNRVRKEGGMLNSLPNKYFRSKSNSNSNNENLSLKQLQEKYSKLQKKLEKLAPNNDGQIWIMEELLNLSLKIFEKQKSKSKKTRFNKEKTPSPVKSKAKK